ncbi:HupE/UreJ family protein [Mesorhizobium sp. VK22B]|uniref:HupE/UreJ family protein n=1 Tax=Mesorhizobium captivum TaxID=3072319 RepID=A0ABU4Z342_9HYPH|nr:HupE/UreJ family protein [Mesorhizobium sp. VK22E]MDX8492489.1 HupE/UreJ family protein [Mesorhizobium sp. VK22B]MDX8505578.1 HupE/UreJ family protein [Mesorhizobium sp. VK22E]
MRDLAVGVEPCGNDNRIYKAVIVNKLNRTSTLQRLITAPLAAFMLLAIFNARGAEAHVLGGNFGGFGSGFQHPILGFDHFLAMAAVGIWGAQIGGRSVWTLPVTFPLIMCIGGVIDMSGILVLPYVEAVIACSVLALGLAIATRWRPPELLLIPVIAVFAIFHGFAHGIELPQAADPAAYAVGFVVATGLIHIFGILLGMAVERVNREGATRAVGGLIAASGLAFLIP